MINFEETELRLGLPGNESSTTLKGSGAKRGFSQTAASVDLKLNLSSSNNDPSSDSPSSLSTQNPKDNTTTAAPAKSQVVGWPPVRSFRKNIVNRKNGNEEEEKNGNGGGCLVKVSMDGAPYLRKVDIKLYKSYQELSDSLAKMFSSFTIGNCGSQQDTKFNGSDYVPTYQDKDGDWMLVGDVPWEMFLESCKRLRIMKPSEAIGLVPRAVEKYKTRS